MSRKLHKETCGYCGVQPASEREHVIARQFFPPEKRFRGDLPRIPSCRNCNAAKQKAEDGPAVIFQFGHFSEASERVLQTRVRRTLAKNRRLLTTLQQGLHEVWARQNSGLVVPTLALTLSERELGEIHDWFRFVTRGLYYFEFGSPIPEEYTIHLVKPASMEQFLILRDLVAQDSKHQRRSFANGEFRYIFAANHREQVSMWLFAFKSIDMVSIVIGPTCPNSLQVRLSRIEWQLT